MLCQRHRPNLKPLLETLRPFVDAGAMTELANILAEIQTRIDRVDRAAGG
jgi:hypothetical protein